MYRVTTEGGAHGTVTDLGRRRLLRVAERAGATLTRVPRGVVIALPGGQLIAVLR